MVTSVRPTPVRLKKGLRGWLTALPFILPGHLSDALFVKNDILNLLKRSQFNICRKKYKMCKNTSAVAACGIPNNKSFR